MMKHTKSRPVMLSLLSVALLAGCMQGGTLEAPQSMRYVVGPDGCLIGVGTAGTSMDASGTSMGDYCWLAGAINPATNARHHHPFDPQAQPGFWVQRRTMGQITPTAATQLLSAAISGPGTGMVQGIWGREIARTKSGGGGSGAAAQALAQQQQQSVQQQQTRVDVNISGCPSCTAFGG